MRQKMNRLTCSVGHSGQFPETSEDHRIITAYRAIGEAATRLGDASLPDALIACAEGNGAGIDDLFALIARDSAAGASAIKGDVIVTSPLFDEAEPRIEIVGAPMGWEETNSPFPRGKRCILRPAATAETLPPSTGAVNSESLTKALQLVGLAGSAGSATRSVLEAGSAGVRLANEGIDLIQRVATIGSKVRQSFNGLSFQSQAAGLRIDGYTPPTSRENTTTYNLQLSCAHKQNASVTDPFNWALYNFRIVIVHDCFNIIRAEVVRGTYDLGGYVGLLPHRLTINFSPDVRTFRSALPGQIRFRVSGTWDPADLLGRLSEGVNGTIVVRADGSAQATGFAGRLVKAPPLRRVSGPSRASCQANYEALRRRSQPQAVTPAPAEPVASGAGGRQWRPSSRPAVRDPAFGKHVFFRSGGYRITPTHRAAVRSWWTSLGPNRQQAVIRGQVHIRVNGHADPTGSENANIRISTRRADAVAGLVRALTGANARIDFEGVGSRVARSSGIRGRAPEWRRATIHTAFQ